MTTFAEFQAEAGAVGPRVAVVLGSGLATAAADFRPATAIDYAHIPGLVPPTIAGHPGRLAVGIWDSTPALVCFGRIHFYEGHPWERVTQLVNLAADLGARVVILTNAAGGLRPDLRPGSLMPLREHRKLVGRDAWRKLESAKSPYAPRLLASVEQLDPTLVPGTYAALTGPSYETPAEIRALRVMGVDAVGMSTAVEAESAFAHGLEVAAISCITNFAAGLTDRPLSHSEVEANARLSVERLGRLIGGLVNTVE